MVCFCNPVSITGKIPGKFKLSFFIADKNTFKDKLLDIIDVDKPNINLLEDSFISYLRGQVFEARKYDLTSLLEDEAVISENELELKQGKTQATIVGDNDVRKHIDK